MSIKLFGWTKKLQIKLLTIILVTVSVFTSIFVLHGMRQARKVIHEQSDTYGSSLAKGIANACSEALYNSNYDELKTIIETIGKSYDSIHGIEVQVAGALVGRYSSIDEGDGINLDRMITQKGVRFASTVLVFAHNKRLELGVVHVIFSRDRFYEVYVEQVKTSIILGSILLIEITVLLYFLLHRLIIKPISMIEKGATIIGGGDLNYRIEVDTNDEIGSLAMTFNNMTMKLKASKEQIERWNEELEQKVKERTYELERANRKLKNSQLQLMQSSKMAAVGFVGASVAHELYNPLGGISGYVQFILQKIRNPSFKREELKTCEKYLRHIERETQRCHGIVNNLLNLAKKKKQTFEPVDIKETVNMAVSIMEYQMRLQNIDIRTQFPSEKIMVNGSADRLEQVFINLIANAQKAMPDGGSLDIRIVNNKYDQHNKMIEVQVQDTGCGIAAENIEKIFESFMSINKYQSNLGIGLYLSNGIVKEHGGRMVVASEVGKGSTFSVILPMV